MVFRRVIVRCGPLVGVFFFKQKTAYEILACWSSDVCSSDLFLRSVAEAVLQLLMEADVEGLIGAGRHERTGERLNYRNRSEERRVGKECRSRWSTYH